MKPPVIIVGAGAAGLAAADALLEANINFLILEAADRPGGRIKTQRSMADFPVELGAEEIHGPDISSARLAEDAHIPFLRHSSSSDCLRLDGRVIFWDEALKDPDMLRANDFIASLGKQDNPGWTLEQLLARAHFPRRTRHYLDSRLGVEHGTSLDRLGVVGFRDYPRAWEAREHNFTLGAPYEDILTPFLSRIADRIRYRSAVARVVWGGKHARIDLQAGESLRSRAVIVTSSVAMLRASVPLFEPELPAEKRAAIARIGMDAGMKIILRFRRRFWPENMYFLHSDGFLPQFWATGKGREGQTPVLTAFVGGNRYGLLESLACNPIDYALEELDAIFGDDAASKNFAEGLVADWGAEPYIGGLYSYTRATTTPHHRALLAQPLGQQVYFAGEATESGADAGTVHGAVNSGRRAARELIQDLFG